MLASLATRSVLVAAVAGGVLLAGCRSERVPQSTTGIDSVFQLLTPDTPAQAAKDMVDPFDPDKRYRGMSRIAAAPWGGEDVYVRIYAEAIQNDTDVGVRAVAARALGNHGSPEHVKLIVPLLSSEDARVRFEAARALQRLHSNEAIAPLGKLLVGTPDPARPARDGKPGGVFTEPDKDVRAAAAEALGQYADPLAAQSLIIALTDDDLVVSRTARKSLRTITGQDFGDDPAAWRAFVAGPNPFAARTAYTYPAFRRGKYTWERLPFWPEPPNEASANPTGYEPPVAGK